MLKRLAATVAMTTCLLPELGYADQTTGAAAASDSTQTVKPGSGWSFGPFAVPFKYELGGHHDIEGSASYGGYLGARFPEDQTGLFAATIIPIVFGGVGTVSASSTDPNGKGSSSSQLAFSIGAGVLLQPFSTEDTQDLKGSNSKSPFTIGLVVGVDYSSSSYQYNHRPWIAFQVGWNFGANTGSSSSNSTKPN